MKLSYKVKSLILIKIILCILIGIASGVYFEFFDESATESNTINWEKGLFRIGVIISIVDAVVIGSSFAFLAITGKFVLGNFGNDHKVFFRFATVFLGFWWLVYFIIQWLIYYAALFVINGFTS